MKARSLRADLLRRLLAVQAALILLIAALAVAGPNSDVQLDVSSHPESLLKAGPAGFAAELQALRQRSPEVRAAIFAMDGEVWPGSDMPLARLTAGVTEGGFAASLGDGRPYSVTVTRHSGMRVALASPSSGSIGWRALTTGLLLAAPLVLVLGAAAGLSVWLTLGAGLKPIRIAAAAAEQIDPERLADRLPEDAAPSELRPLLRAVNKALDRLAAGFAEQRRFTADAAHELRTPLSILELQLAQIAEAGPRSAIEREVRRLRVRVEQLLSIAKLGRRPEPELHRVDLAAATRACVADFAPAALRGAVELMVDAPAAPVWVKADPAALESILSNLIDNALRFSPANGAIALSVVAEGAVRIVDHGPGLSADARERVFQEFRQEQPNDKGAGLGLAIARRAAETMGGTLTAEARDDGAEFLLRLRPAD